MGWGGGDTNQSLPPPSLKMLKWCKRLIGIEQCQALFFWVGFLVSWFGFGLGVTNCPCNAL